MSLLFRYVFLEIWVELVIFFLFCQCTSICFTCEYVGVWALLYTFGWMCVGEEEEPKSKLNLSLSLDIRLNRWYLPSSSCTQGIRWFNIDSIGDLILIGGWLILIGDLILMILVFGDQCYRNYNAICQA